MQKISRGLIVFIVFSLLAGLVLLFIIIRNIIPGSYKPNIESSSLMNLLKKSKLKTLKNIHYNDVPLEVELLESKNSIECVYLFDHFGCEEILFRLYTNHTGALKDYEQETKSQRISQHYSEGMRRYFVTFAREDVCSGVFLTGQYVCKAGFLIDNLFISLLWIKDKKSLDKSINTTLKELAILLNQSSSSLSHAGWW